jgi:hypothetical protein
MKKVTLFLLSATFLVLQSCQPKETKTETPAEETKVVGADADAHGCKGSAGYTWSELKQNCIRIFEDGVKMTAADATLDQTTAAFAVFNADSSKVELFIPLVANGIILSKTEAGKWADSVYVFSAKEQQCEIQKGKSLLYKK